MLDPDHFRDLAPATADLASRTSHVESPAVQLEFQEEAEFAAAELRAAAEMIEATAIRLDARGAAEACQFARQLLRDLEEGFWAMAR
jgi:hypothetical protein